MPDMPPSQRTPSPFAQRVAQQDAVKTAPVTSAPAAGNLNAELSVDSNSWKQKISTARNLQQLQEIVTQLQAEKARIISALERFNDKRTPVSQRGAV